MQSIEKLYQEYAQIIYRYLFSLTHNHDISEELTQETFCQAITSIRSFKGSCKISTWLCSIAKNQLYKYYHNNPPNEDWMTQVISVPSAETEAIANLTLKEFISHIEKCSNPYKQVLSLRLFGNLSFLEIGTIMDKTETWARVTYYRGKEKLRKELENE